MSRKITSGSTVSSDARTSAPLRHSPTTVNSGNGASSCRTPRRAAGSSSATRTFHSACGIIRSYRRGVVRNGKGRNGADGAGGRDVERRAVAIQGLQPLARVGETMSLHGGPLLVEREAVVRDGYFEQVSDAPNGHNDPARIGTPRN